MRVLRWPIGCFVLLVGGVYVALVVTIVPWWALGLGAGMWAVLLRARASRRGPRSLGSERQVMPHAP